MTDKVVVYSSDPLLLPTRRLLLERAGFTVFTTSHFEEKIELMTTQEPQLLNLSEPLRR
jgi:DNA-binding response OmpR family regulator